MYYLVINTLYVYYFVEIKGVRKSYQHGFPHLLKTFPHFPHLNQQKKDGFSPALFSVIYSGSIINVGV